MDMSGAVLSICQVTLWARAVNATAVPSEISLHNWKTSVTQRRENTPSPSLLLTAVGLVFIQELKTWHCIAQSVLSSVKGAHLNLSVLHFHKFLIKANISYSWFAEWEGIQYCESRAETPVVIWRISVRVSDREIIEQIPSSPRNKKK